MLLVLSNEDISKLRQETIQDLRGLLWPATPGGGHPPESDVPIDWQDVVDLSRAQVEEFVQGCAPETTAGLRVLAKFGPVIRADVLNGAGIFNYSHFQGCVTKRTRTVTRNRHAYLFGWDNWSSAENREYGCGHYGVTSTTLESLRSYFGVE